MSFALPALSDETLEIGATVVWCNAAGDSSGPGGRTLGMGISFDDPRECATLAALLERD